MTTATRPSFELVPGVPRRGELVPARLCLNERRAAPMPQAAHARGVSVSHPRGHARNNLCPAGVSQ